MPLVILAALAFIASAFLGATVGPSFGPFLEEPTYAPISAVCLDENVARNGIGAVGNVPGRLTEIKRPEREDFIANQGWDHPSCGALGSCSDHPNEAEYLLVATKVKVDPVIFRNSFTGQSAPSDRQMLRYTQTGVSTNPEVQAQLKGRMFRTFCGDWCVLSLPYRGSFYCDFLFYLEDKDEEGNSQIDANGNLLQPNTVDANLPKNGSLFSIYFRKDAQIPEKIKCTTPTPSAQNSNFFLGKRNSVALAQEDQSGFAWPPDSLQEWLFRRESAIKNTEVNPQVTPFLDPATGSNLVVDPIQGVNGEFEVFKNLGYPSSDEILYLVPEGAFDTAMAPLSTPTPTQPPPPAPTASYQPVVVEIPFKEFHLLKVVQPRDARSLQLGTFFPPQAADWIKSWYEESKPAIYLYPPHDTAMSVKLNPAGYLTVSDPPYVEPYGWQNFTAHPDGTLTYQGKKYPYLYYEADLPRFSVEPVGFVVEGENLVSFFEEVLPKLGLAGREIEEFIEYWMGRLDTNQPYYFIHFLEKEKIEQIEPIVISQNPDVEIRIRAYFKPLFGPISIKPQQLIEPPRREGFVLVEWGGILDN